MAFDDNIDKSTSHKIVLFEYDLPIDNDVLINFEAGIWFNRLTPGVVTVTGSDGQVGYYSNTNEIKYNIQSLKIGPVDYTKVDSLEELRIQNASFYYDSDTTDVYIHFDGFDNPLDKIILWGSVEGFTTEADRIRGAVYNDVLYDARIKTVPALNKRKDPLFFGVIAFSSGSVSLSNEDGNFDTFNEQNAFRQPARVLFGFEGDDYSEFNKIFTGYMENYTRSFIDFTVQIQDTRKSLSRSIPTRVLTVDEFEFLSEDNVDAIKPLAYGQINNAPVLCLNGEEATPVNYDFLIMDTTDHDATSVSEVKVAGDLVDPGDYSIDLTTGVLSVDALIIVDDFDEVSCSFVGHNEYNALDVTKDLMLIYGDIAFIDSNFDTTEWNTARANAKDVGVFIDDDIKLIDVIGKIMSATDGLFFTKIDGKYTCRLFDEDREPDRTIQTYEWIGDPKINNNGSEFLSSVNIMYDKDLKNDRSKQYLNTDSENDVLARYKSYQQRTFNTVLYKESDAILKSDLVMSLSEEIKDIVTRKIKMQHYDLELGDFIVASPCTRYTQTDDFGVYEIIGKSVNFNSFEITLTMKYIKDFIETDIVYTQGYLQFEKLFNDKLLGPTRYDEVVI